MCKSSVHARRTKNRRTATSAWTLDARPVQTGARSNEMAAPSAGVQPPARLRQRPGRCRCRRRRAPRRGL
eukprot:scaffold12117_cov189-Isochrysis_galbana.AAC.2